MYPDSKFLLFRGLSIHYRVIRPKGTVAHRALLLPSPGQSSYNWRKVVPELLSAGCLCVLCDLPGFGYSAAGDGVPHRQDLRAQLMWGVLDHVDMELGGQLKCWNLIGHGSAAGTVAMMAMMQPDSVSSLTLINPMLYPPVPRLLARLVETAAGEAALRRWYRRNLQDRSRFRRWANWAYGKPLPYDALEAMRKPFVRLGSDEGLSKLLAQGYRLPTDKLAALFMPTMVLWGDRDRILGSAIPRRLRERDFPGAEYHLLRGAGHYAPETASAAVRDYLRGWIKAMW
ncbi:MAG: alpha/beta hydrolase [Clostridiales bacterium]|nr:alpha/beta hydrolase [Clostridiales bacterium]